MSADASTIRDVARLAEVSHQTVSRVLNAPDTVRRDTRLRVEAAMAALAYTRNDDAVRLGQRRSRPRPEPSHDDVDDQRSASG